MDALHLVDSDISHTVVLGTMKNEVELQSITWDSLNGDWYMSQAVGDSCAVHRFDKTGTYVSTMTCENAGHGSQISCERINDSLYIWLSWNTLKAGKIVDRAVCRIFYEPGLKKKSDATVMPSFTNGYAVPALDAEADRIVLRVIGAGKEYYKVYKLSDLKRNIKTQIGHTVGGWASDAETFQGLTINGDTIYRLTGKTTSKADYRAGNNKAVYLHEYDAQTGKEIKRLNLATAGGKTDDAVMSSEPEGAAITSMGLVVAFKMGSGGPGASDEREMRVITVVPSPT